MMERRLQGLEEMLKRERKEIMREGEKWMTKEKNKEHTYKRGGGGGRGGVEEAEERVG